MRMRAAARRSPRSGAAIARRSASWPAPERSNAWTRAILLGTCRQRSAFSRGSARSVSAMTTAATGSGPPTEGGASFHATTKPGGAEPVFSVATIQGTADSAIAMAKTAGRAVCRARRGRLAWWWCRPMQT